MRYCIFDIEGNGLLDTITKIWTLSYAIFDSQTLISSGTITDTTQMVKFLNQQEILVGHKIIEYDIPAIEKVLGEKITPYVIDTLAISFYLFPIKNFVHGLEAWGERYGFPKPKIDTKEWAGPLPGETKEEFFAKMTHRCESDVEINKRLFFYQMDYCMAIYGDLDKVMRLFGYLNFKMECLRDQEEARIKLDVSLAEKSKLDLEFVIDEKMSALAKHMPRVVDKVAPKVMYKKDGSLSHYGEKWKALLKLKKLPEDAMEITVPGNPASPDQLKDWLFELGWKPKTFKKNKKGKKIPQVSLPFGAGLCPSVKDLFEVHPFLEELGGLYKARHRYGLFKSFLENKDDEDYVYSRAQGFTNTLRLQHAKPIANLPGVEKYYGPQVRGCLTVPDDSYLMCGSDISGLEDNTKQHYIYFYDPDYVNDMRVPGFDPHIDIAVLADMLTKEDEEFFKWYESQEEDFPFTDDQKENMKRIKKIRGSAKTVNFSATYGAGAPKIAETLKCDLAFAETLHRTYWKRNAAVKQTAKDATVKTVFGQKWIYNPISKLWLFLKADKDRFSTLNQSSGVYFFDTWVKHVRRGLKERNLLICMQYHDEILLYCKKVHKDFVDKVLAEAMKAANNECKLNVELGFSIDWGTSYADCH